MELTTTDASCADVEVYVQSNLASSLSLAVLSEVAGYSPTHFQRRFVEMMGESPHHYVLRVRLERAAHFLVATDNPIEQVASWVGYSRAETFSRVFKQHFGTTASAYRSQPRRSLSETMACHGHSAGRPPTLTPVRIEQRVDVPLAFIRQRGAYTDATTEPFERLASWRSARWKGAKPGLLIGICHDNPDTTPAENVRFDACISVPDAFASETGVSFQPFPAGTFAAVTYRGVLGDELAVAYRALATSIAESRRYELVGVPGIEIYQTPGLVGDGDEHCVDVLLPVTCVHNEEWMTSP